ncbi:MAG: hypothetical protein JSV05_03685 [Candidatus Bathyarchaeota archaeon]|nr:MAG: hypothetical protein JSV05_03685 [Candidatus Bathyarchaeota archaeon]
MMDAYRGKSVIRMGKYTIKLAAGRTVKDAEQQAQKLLDQHERKGFTPILLASGESKGEVNIAIVFQKIMDEKPTTEVIGEEEFQLPKRLSAEVTKLTKLTEEGLYEVIGEALLAEELLKQPTKLLDGEGIKDLLSKTRKAESRKKGKQFVNKLRGRMFQKICVEAQACKWEKHVLKDTQGLAETLMPLIGSIVGFTIPAISLSIAIILTKKGIKQFCKCPSAY